MTHGEVSAEKSAVLCAVLSYNGYALQFFSISNSTGPSGRGYQALAGNVSDFSRGGISALSLKY